MIANRRPNVLVFFTDQQRWDCSGLHGNPLELMPHFDRLARAGTHIRNSFTCQPLCVPARAAFQTGRYPSQLGTFRNDCPLPAGTPTLAHHFAAGGYRTGYIGKWHLAPREHPGAVPAASRGGYHDWLASNVLELVSDAYETRLYDENGVEHRPPGYRVDALTDAAIRYIATPRSQPFFLFVSYLEPHHQNQRDDYPAPDGYSERYNRGWMPRDLAELDGSAREQLAGYCGMVRRLDEALGRIYDALKSTQQLDNTILLFTSDHGCHFKTRNDEYKRSPHESSIRVPTMFHGPGFMQGGDRKELVSLIDLPPTLLAAAGLPIPASIQGQSLFARLHGAVTEWPQEVLVEVSEAQSGRALRTARWKYCVAVPDTDVAAAWHAAEWPVYLEHALYDLENDPAELHNVIGVPGHESIAATLRLKMLERLAGIGRAVPEIIRAVPRVATRPRGKAVAKLGLSAT